MRKNWNYWKKVKGKTVRSPQTEKEESQRLEENQFEKNHTKAYYFFIFLKIKLLAYYTFTGLARLVFKYIYFLTDLSE